MFIVFIVITNLLEFPFYLQIIIYSIMELELTKANLMQLSINQSVLTHNFTKIEDCLKALTREIDILKKDNAQLKQKVACIGSEKIDESLFKQQHFEIDCQNLKQQQNSKENGKQKMKALFNRNKSSGNPNATVITPIEKVRFKNKNNKENFPLNSFQNKQANQQQLYSGDDNFSDEQGFIKLQMRIQELERGKLQLEQRIYKILTESTGKKHLKRKTKILGSVKGNLTALKTLKNLQEQSEGLLSNRMETGHQDKSQIQYCNSQKQEDLINHIDELSQEELSDYLIKKVKQLLEDQKSCFRKVKQLQRNQTVFSKSQQLIKRDMENVEAATRQIERLSLVAPTQKYRKGTSDQQSRVLNDTMESNRAFYQDKLIQLFEQMDRIKKQYLIIADKLNDEQGSSSKSLALRVQQLKGTNDDSVKKQVSQHRRELKRLRQQFDRLLYGVNTGSNQVRTLIIKPNQNKQDWKSLTTKINKTKSDLTTTVRQLEGKININNEMIATIGELEVSIGECKLVLQRKCEAADFQKGIKRLESRLNNFIRQIYQKEGISIEKDAMIVKQPWFCLSCDNQLKNYTGKSIKPRQTQILPGKKVNPESHMIRRGQSKIPTLPSFHGN